MAAYRVPLRSLYSTTTLLHASQPFESATSRKTDFARPASRHVPRIVCKNLPRYYSQSVHWFRSMGRLKFSTAS
eukprot:15064014-Heterocapsa_arctica.AAC.1